MDDEVRRLKEAIDELKDAISEKKDLGDELADTPYEIADDIYDGEFVSAATKTVAAPIRFAKNLWDDFFGW